MMKYDNTADALKAIMSQFGSDVLLGKLNNLLADFAPSVPMNYKRLVNAVHAFGASDVLKKSMNGSAAEKEAAAKIAIRHLTDAFISKKIAEDVVFEFVDALGWKIPRPSQSSQPLPQTTPSLPPQQKSSLAPQSAPQPAPQSILPLKPKPVKRRRRFKFPSLPRFSLPRFQLPSFLRSNPHSGTPIFAIVDRDSGLGSEILFGIIGASVGLSVGVMIGGFIGIILGLIIGWSFGSGVIGKSVYVNLLEIIIGSIVGFFAAFFITWAGGALFPGVSPVVMQILFIPFMIAATVLYLIARSRGIKLLFIALIALGIGGLITIISPKFSSDTAHTGTVTEQTAVEEATATVTSGVNFRSGPSVNEAVIRQLQQGDTVILTGSVMGGWTQILHNGDTGWVSSEYLSK